MGIASFVFGREAFRTKISEIVVDCTLQIVTDLTAQVSKNPVQKGSNISDHVQLEPLVLKIEGLISESPIGNIQDEIASVLGGVAGGVLGKVGQATKVGGAGLGGTGLGAAIGSKMGGYLTGYSPDRTDGTFPQKAMGQLIDAYESRTPFLIRTFFWTGSEARKLYDSMVITALSFPQSPAEGRSLKFSLTAEKVKIVNLQVQTVDADFILGDQASNSGQAKTDLGRQGTEAPKAKTVTTSTGLLQELNELGDL